MKPRERVAAALDHVQPDRCPFSSTFTPEFAKRLRAALRAEDPRAHNPHGGGNPYDLERAIGVDLLLTSVGWANSYYLEEQDYVDEWGVGWHLVAYTTPYGIGHYTEPNDHPLADDAALSSYRPPDPNRDELYEDSARVIREFGGDYWIVGATVTTIFETAWALRGLERLLMDFVQAPDLADEILEIPYRYHLTAAERLVRMGVDMIWLGDDIGQQNGMLMSPKHWRRFLKPRMAEFITTIKGINPRLKVAYHTDGHVWAVLPELVEIGVDVLNPIQPAALDPVRLAREYGRDLCFWGSVDVQGTLPFGTPDDVRREVRQRLATLGANGGLILSPSQHVQLDTPLENFWAMVEEVTGTAPAGLVTSGG
jgi:uroporphyrinogen decarboxylase